MFKSTALTVLTLIATASLASSQCIEARAVFPTVSISSADLYRLAHYCVQQVVWYVKDTLNCAYDGGSGGYLNDCYCRDDTQGNALSYMSSVIPKSCTVGAESDLSTAIAIYTSYCATAGKQYSVPPVTGSAALTISGSTASTSLVTATPLASTLAASFTAKSTSSVSGTSSWVRASGWESSMMAVTFSFAVITLCLGVFL